MISFRFHLVSLVAVFLALGLGVLTGTTVLNKGIVERLEANTANLSANLGRIREEVEDLRTAVDIGNRFGSEVMPSLVGGRLSGSEVIVITQEGADDEGLGGVQDALEAGGASVEAVFSVADRMALPEEGDRRALEELVAAPADMPREDLLAEAAQRLADGISVRAVEPDVLTLLLDQGFMLNRGPSFDEEDARRLADPGQIVAVVAGTEGRPVLRPDLFLVPVVERLAENGANVAAFEAQDADPEFSFVGAVRENDAADLVVTQDNVDQIYGEIGLVLAIEDLVQQGRAGHYGVKRGADRLLPPM